MKRAILHFLKRSWVRNLEHPVKPSNRCILAWVSWLQPYLHFIFNPQLHMLVFDETELQLLYNFNLVKWNLHNELFYKFRAEKKGWNTRIL